MIASIQPGSPWDSLEIAKLAVSVLTPIVVILIGVCLRKHLVNLEKGKWVSQKIIESRLEFYEKIGNPLNEIVVYFLYIGDWKGRNPNDILELKRKVDRMVFVANPFLSGGVLGAYKSLMDCLFETYRGKGKDAQIRTAWESRKDSFSGEAWDEDWEKLFCPENRETKEVIGSKYSRLLLEFRWSFGLSGSDEILEIQLRPKTQPPSSK